MIIVGGLTRLTDSGLSITEWELFSGFFPPLNQNDWIVYFNLYKQIPEFKLQNYNMTLKEFKVINPEYTEGLFDAASTGDKDFSSFTLGFISDQ